ncbi:MAG: class I SAM-dependent methyltransferase [candidate division WOR-3 bacterium]
MKVEMIEDSGSLFVGRRGCPICGVTGELIVDTPLEHPRLKSWLREKYAGRVPHTVIQSGHYKLRYCRNCQFLYQSEVLADQWLVELYERWIDPEESLRKNRLMRNRKGRYEILVASLIAKTPSASHACVLDFGGGWGDWAVIAQCLGYDVDVAELSPTRQSFLRNKGIRVVDLNSSEEFRGKYTFIRAEQVFEHLVAPVSVLSQLSSFLMHRGIIYISVPNVLPICRKLDALAELNISDEELKLIAPLEHINGFTPKSMNRLARQVGLRRMFLRPTFIDGSRGLLGTLLSWLLLPLRESTTLTLVKEN